MDDSREDAHRMVQDIYRFAGEKVFIDDRLDPGRYEDSRRLFETVREEEDDAYYVYDGILEKHYKRWKLNNAGRGVQIICYGAPADHPWLPPGVTA